jgi:glycine/D-amino acid oxidase-like deaminating enzyme
MVYGENQLYTKLASRAYHLWERYQKLFGKRCLFPTGNLWLCSEGDPIIDRAMEILDDNNLPYARINQQKAAQQFPNINFTDVGFVLHEKMTGYLLARESTIAVRNYFVRQGGKYLRSVPDVNGLLQDGHKLPTFDGSKIHADAYIFACGPWLPTIFPGWLSETLTVTRQELHYFGIPMDVGPHIESMPTWIDHTTEDFYYGIPNTSYRGLKLASDVRGKTFDPTTGDRSTTKLEVDNARAYLSKRFPAMKNAPLLESRVCQYSNTVDGNFIFDQHPSYDNIYSLGGGSGHGFKHGPALGEKIAAIMLGESGIPGDWLIN